ncbi:MAG: DUF3365 domain-containing protein [Gemmatimonadales bacterium]|nr:MAG: DUF3365 domain-containing protein [Gemmatimonadales bacterium]
MHPRRPKQSRHPMYLRRPKRSMMPMQTMRPPDSIGPVGSAHVPNPGLHPPHALRLLLPLFMVGTVGLFGCQGDSDELATSEPAIGVELAESVEEAPPEPLDPELHRQVMERADPVARAVAQGLMARVSATMDEDGPAGALHFCADEALRLTAEIAGTEDPELDVKRTTSQTRNPANAPDEYETRILAWMEALEAAEPGSAPDVVTAAGPDGSLRLHRAVRMAPACMQCHGSEAEIHPEVRPVLEERYPGDLATGYSPGDFRGLIRVEVPAGSAPAPRP